MEATTELLKDLNIKRSHHEIDVSDEEDVDDGLTVATTITTDSTSEEDSFIVDKRNLNMSHQYVNNDAVTSPQSIPSNSARLPFSLSPCDSVILNSNNNNNNNNNTSNNNNIDHMHKETDHDYNGNINNYNNNNNSNISPTLLRRESSRELRARRLKRKSKSQQRRKRLPMNIQEILMNQRRQQQQQTVMLLLKNTCYVISL